MQKVSAVEFVRSQVKAVCDATGEVWQIEIGENMTLDLFLAQDAVQVPAAFISYGRFHVDAGSIDESGQAHKYEDTLAVYFLREGDMWPVVRSFVKHMNGSAEDGSKYNQFTDEDGIEQQLTIQSGDGLRLQFEGYPGFEVLLTV